MSMMLLERPAPLTGEHNHSCSSGACGNCGNPGNVLVPVDAPATGTDVIIPDVSAVRV